MRQTELDSLRGLLLVLMTITHLPTAFSAYTIQPLGFVSAAEGFVLLSAFFTGFLFVRRMDRHGLAAARQNTWLRALQLYRYHLMLMAFTLTVMAVIAVYYKRTPLLGLMSFYLEHPVLAILSSPILVYRPPLLDILPMYVIFLFLSPLITSYGHRRGWAGILAVSVGTWVFAQFGGRQMMHAAFVNLTGLPMPYTTFGAFNLLAWQLLWVAGLWLGDRRAVATKNAQGIAAVPANASAVPRLWLYLSAAICVVFFLWTHKYGPFDFDRGGWFRWLGKWDLGAIRMVNITALALVIIAWGLPLLRKLNLKPLVLLGQASLNVFCAHLLLCLLSLALINEREDPLPMWAQITLLIVTLSALFGVALWTRQRNSGKPGKGAAAVEIAGLGTP